jgi:hypothetical protein
MEFFLVTARAPGVRVVPREDSPTERCPKCRRPRDVSPDAVYRVEVTDPDQLADLMHPPPIYLGSPAFSEWYEASGLAGLQLEPAEGADPLRRIRPGSIAKLARSSEIEVVESCDECGFEEVDIVGVWSLAKSSWDGSDFFTVRERPESLFCTTKAQRALEESGLEGPVFIERELISI